MFFETLKLKINFEPLLPADVAIRFLILFSFFSFLPKLWKFIDDCSWKDFKDNFFYE